MINNDLHTIRYRDLFNSHKVSSPHFLSLASNKRLIILSDCHFDGKFDENVYNKFVKIINKADFIIINGDFWADSFISFDKFMKTPWNKLFPLLKKKRAYYIFGNHDMPVNSDKRIYEFCTWAGFRLKVKAGKISLHVEHGHLLSKYWVRKILTIFEKSPKGLMIATFPFGVIETLVSYFSKKSGVPVFNLEFKDSRYNVSEKNEYFVMGHTHTPELDHLTKYINTGRTHNGHFDYVEVFNNKISLRSL